MDSDDTQHSPLKAARKAKRLSLAALATLTNTSAQQIDRLEKGERKLTKEWAERLAPHLSTSPEALLFQNIGIVPVVGFISAGGSIETSSEQMDEPLFEIEIPIAISSDVIGFEVQGQSMWPKFDPGDVIIAHRHGEPLEMFLGYDAVVTTEDGNRYLKRVIKSGEAGKYDLESYNAPPMRGLQIQWGSGVVVVVPASRWRKLNGRSITSAVRQVRRSAV